MRTISTWSVCLIWLATILVPLASGMSTAGNDPELRLRTQDAQDADDLVTIRGQLVPPPSWKQPIDWLEFKCAIVEQIEFESPALPTDWNEMSPAERTQWQANFRASEAGKALIARNEQRAKQRRVMEFEIESDGRFVIYDVPRAKFNLQASSQVKSDSQTFMLQSFGQFEVGQVTEIDLSRMQVDVFRLLQLGEEAPNLTVQTVAGESVSLTSMRGKYVLLVFGALTNPSFRAATDAMQELQQSPDVQGKLSMLLISVDEDTDAATKFLRQEQIEFPCGLLGKWDQALLSQYGIKSVPSFWLIDRQGNIVLTGSQFVLEINRQQTTIQKLVEDGVTGRLKLSEPDPTTDQADDKSSQQSNDN